MLKHLFNWLKSFFHKSVDQILQTYNSLILDLETVADKHKNEAANLQSEVDKTKVIIENHKTEATRAITVSKRLKAIVDV